MLGPRVGGVLWAWLSLAVYGAGLWVFARHVLPVRWTDDRLAVYLALGLFGGLHRSVERQEQRPRRRPAAARRGMLVERRRWSAAFLLAGALTVKLTPLAPLLLLCALWPRSLTPRFAVALAVLAAVPFLTRPPDVVVGHYRAFAQHLRESEHERWPGFRDAWTVWQVARDYAQGEEGIPWLKEPLVSPAYRAVQLLTAFAALLWCLWLRRRGVPERRTRHADAGRRAGVADAVRPGRRACDLRLPGPGTVLGRAGTGGQARADWHCVRTGDGPWLGRSDATVGRRAAGAAAGAAAGDGGVRAVAGSLRTV